MLGPAWIEDAACAGHDPILWDVEWASYDENCRGVTICRGCPVQDECHAEAESQAQPVGIMARRVYGKTGGAKNGMPMAIPADFAVHGSQGSYRRGCRCGPCNAASYTSQRELENRNLSASAGRPKQPCGSHAAFTRHRAFGERPCLECDAAERQHQREVYARRKAREMFR